MPYIKERRQLMERRQNVQLLTNNNRRHIGMDKKLVMWLDAK